MRQLARAGQTEKGVANENNVSTRIVDSWWEKQIAGKPMIVAAKTKMPSLKRVARVRRY